MQQGPPDTRTCNICCQCSVAREKERMVAAFFSWALQARLVYRCFCQLAAYSIMLLDAAVNFLCSLGSHEYEQHWNIPQVAFFDCHCGGCPLIARRASVCGSSHSKSSAGLAVGGRAGRDSCELRLPIATTCGEVHVNSRQREIIGRDFEATPILSAPNGVD